jgi:hypothetical protein
VRDSQTGRFVIARPRSGGSARRSIEGRASAVRWRVHVQSADPANDACSGPRALRISDQGPSVVYALSRAGARRSVPGANMIWRFREALKKAEAIDVLSCRFDEALRASSYLAMGGQIVDATIIAAPKQRNIEDEKKAIKEGCKTAKRGFVSCIHRKKPKGRPLPGRLRIANARKSKIRSAVEHVFAHQKGWLGPVTTTIGLARAKVKIGLATASSGSRAAVCPAEAKRPRHTTPQAPLPKRPNDCPLRRDSSL